MIASLVLATLSAGATLAAPTGVLKHKAPKDPEERPVVVKASIKPQGSDFALRLEFDKTPWGAACKQRCASATLVIDTDNDASTGMQQGRGKPLTGGDLVVIVQGVVDYMGESAQPFVKVKVRHLEDTDRTIEDGEPLQDYDHRRDTERVEADGKEITVLVDASNGIIPAGKTCRLVYLPPSARPVVAPCKGMAGAAPAARSSRDVQIIKGSRTRRGGGASYSTGTPTRRRTRASSSDMAEGATSLDQVQVDEGGSAYDPKEKHPLGEGG